MGQMLPGEPEPINDRLSIEGVGEFFIPGLEPEDESSDDDEAAEAGIEADELITPTSMDPAVAARSAAIVALLATEADLEVDDLEVAELVVTEGPVYDLSEFEEAESILDFVEGLRRQRIRFALDRSGSIVVHRNDEARSDALIETLFGPETGEAPTNPEGGVGIRGAGTESGVVFADDVAPPLITSPRRTSWVLYGVLAVVAVVLLIVFVL